jgi:ribosomal protein S16
MLTIRLARFGAKKNPIYRVVVIEKDRARDSKAVEVVGHYNPTAEPGFSIGSRAVPSPPILSPGSSKLIRPLPSA